MNLTGRLECIKNFIKLKQQEEIIEKGIELFLNNTKSDSEFLKNFTEDYISCTEKRKETTKNIYNKMIEINTDFENVKAIVNQFNNGKIIDVNDCKARMNELLEEIKKFGDLCDLEVLQKEQKDLEDYLYDFKVTLKKYESKKNSAPMISKIIRQPSGEKNKTEEYGKVRDFESLIATTGHTQNWKEEDHNYFVKIRNKYHNIPAMVMEIQKKYPDLSAEKIVNHEAWYKIYLDLREKQRSSVKLWRAKKELEKKEKIELIKNNELKKNISQYESKDDIELADNNCESLKMLISKNDISNTVDKKKELIKQWKIDKARAKIVSEVELKNQLENKRILREKEFLTRIMKTKEALLKYQQDKSLKESLRHENERNNIIVKSPTIIKKFRQKDHAFINKRKRLLESKLQNSIKNNNKINYDNKSNTIKSSHHRSTLMKSTIIWDEKCRRQETENKKSLFYIKDIPKLLRHNWSNQESFT